MLVKYYKNMDLVYSSRKRHQSIDNYEPFSSEVQRKVLLGDGSMTTIKTSSSNICDYVTIEDTRWFVVSYEYLNGGQVSLNLQRDVVGEFGFSNVYGKIERGKTDTILKNRKELSLNQVLVDRKYLKPLDHSDDELWGIMYMTKTTDGDVNVPIQSLIPEYINLSSIPNAEPPLNRYIKSSTVISNILFYVSVINKNINYDVYSISINIEDVFVNNNINSKKIEYIGTVKDYASIYTNILITSNAPYYSIDDTINIIEKYYNDVFVLNFNSYINNNLFNIATKNQTNDYDFYSLTKYNIKDGNSIYKYNIENIKTGTYFDRSINDAVFGFDTGFSIGATGYGIKKRQSNGVYYIIDNKTVDDVIILTRNEVFDIDSATITIDSKRKNIDEPYTIMAIPLFDTIINDEEINGEINKNAFNSVIAELSGESGYLVDAQIIRYRPPIGSVVGRIGASSSVYSVVGTSYEHPVSINLYPFSDVKKEYICREYSIVSPEKSDKFSFNFYDYIKTITDNNGTNNAVLNMKIKIALKPFSLVMSAVITPEDGTLMNMTYSSDLRGCQPSANGFEVSIATDQFQQYVRNNSNYQNIFNKNQEYLAKQHQVEKINDTVGAIVNTVSSASMGAIAGASMADVSFLGTNVTKAAGAIAGGITAGTITGTSMGIQVAQNEKLRKYEYNLQQELFDLQIGTIKNLPNTISRISSFNDILLSDFWFVIETYECTEIEKQLVDDYINRYSYSLGVYGFYKNYAINGSFVRGTVITSNLIPILHNILNDELKGGIYYYGNQE